MTDKEIIESYLNLVGGNIETRQVENKTIIFHSMEDKLSPKMTSCGYDEVNSGYIFNEDGSLVRGYTDSHVVASSSNARIIDEFY